MTEHFFRLIDEDDLMDLENFILKETKLDKIFTSFLTFNSTASKLSPKSLITINPDIKIQTRMNIMRSECLRSLSKVVEIVKQQNMTEKQRKIFDSSPKKILVQNVLKSVMETLGLLSGITKADLEKILRDEGLRDAVIEQLEFVEHCLAVTEISYFLNEHALQFYYRALLPMMLTLDQEAVTVDEDPQEFVKQAQDLVEYSVNSFSISLQTQFFNFLFF